MRKLRQKWLTGCMAVTFALAPIVNAPVEAFAKTSVASAKVATFSPTTQRLAGNDRYGTAEQIAQEGWKTSSDYAVLTAGMDENLVDALAAAPLAKVHNAPILLTEGNVLNPKAEAEIKRLGVTTVYVTTGPNVIKKAVTDRLTELGVTTVTMLGGSDRFATAVNIAKEIAAVKPYTQIALTTAWKNADALSVASFAAAKGFPILLTDVNAIPQGTADYINSIKDNISDTYVLGSTGVISQTVEASLPNPQRMGGSDRYATNREILKAFASDIVHGKIFVASGEDNHLVDALAVSPLAGQNLAPVVLTGQTMPTETTDFAKINLLPNQIIALGGESVVPSQSLQALTTLITYADSSITKGSANPAAPETIADTLKISGDNFTLQNAKLAYSIYVQGDKAILKNLEVAGTIFLDPGPTGTSNLENVKAGRIVVLSGAKNSHHFKDTKAKALKIDSESRIETSGATTVDNTSVSAAAILDNVAGSFGKVEVNRGISGIDANKSIEFRGVFDQPIVVKEQVTIKAGTDASIAKVEIATQHKDDKVTLQGAFKAVEVTKEGNLDVAANATIRDQIKVHVPVNIKADPTSTVAKVQINTTKKDANVKVEGTSIGLIDLKSNSNLVIPEGSKVKIVNEASGATIDVAKTAQVQVDSKTNDVVIKGEGKSTVATVDLSAVVSAIVTKEAANAKIDQAQTAKVEAARAAAEATYIAVVATLTATSDAEKAAAASLTAKANEAVAAAVEVAAQANVAIESAKEEVAAAEQQVKQEEQKVDQVTPPSGGGGGDGPTTTTDTKPIIPAAGSDITGTVTRNGSLLSITANSASLTELNIRVLDSDYVKQLLYVKTGSTNEFNLPSDLGESITVIVGVGSNVGTATISSK